MSIDKLVYDSYKHEVFLNRSDYWTGRHRDYCARLKETMEHILNNEIIDYTRSYDGPQWCEIGVYDEMPGKEEVAVVVASIPKECWDEFLDKNPKYRENDALKFVGMEVSKGISKPDIDATEIIKNINRDEQFIHREEKEILFKIEELEKQIEELKKPLNEKKKALNERKEEAVIDVIKSVANNPEKYTIDAIKDKYIIKVIDSKDDQKYVMPRNLSPYILKVGINNINTFREIAESKSRADFMDMLERRYDKNECVYIPSEGVLIEIDPELNKEFNNDDRKLQAFVNDFISERKNEMTYYCKFPSLHIYGYAEIPLEYKECVKDKYRVMEEGYVSVFHNFEKTENGYKLSGSLDDMLNRPRNTNEEKDKEKTRNTKDMDR